MVFNPSIALNLILFLALFPMAFIWLRRAYRIIVRRDFSEVALRRGESPQVPARWAPYTAATNLIGGGVIVYVIASVLFTQMPFDSWTAIGGTTLWMKIIADYIVSRQAYMADQRHAQRAGKAERSESAND